MIINFFYAHRNCLVGKAYHIKISDFGTDNELYTPDYYKVDGSVPLPVRWMAWESIFLVSKVKNQNSPRLLLREIHRTKSCKKIFLHLPQGKYTTKSDVWSFAVTLWEILNLGRRIPYGDMTDADVVESLRQLHQGNTSSCSVDECKDEVGTLFDYLPKPTTSSKDIYDLMLECWRRDDCERPTFREISLFLQRKNLGYAPTS